jgi:hypothetical protein
MGTGDVGLAFTKCQTVHVTDINVLGQDFRKAMRVLGVEDDEATAHDQKHRCRFYSIPIVDPDNQVRYGVLSLDALPPNFFVARRDRFRDAVQRSLTALMEQIRAAHFPGMSKPDGAKVRDEISAKSEDSGPRSLTG